jgi:hypothetical protein
MVKSVQASPVTGISKARICPCGGSSPVRAVRGSSIPNLAPLPLHGNAGGIADLDPDAARAGAICAIDLLGNDALGAKPARMGEHGKPIFGNVFVKQDAGLSIAQQADQRGLAFEERAIALLDQVEGVE